VAAERRVARGRRVGAALVGVAVVALAVAGALRPGPLTLAGLIIVVYLGLRLAVREVLARHDRPLWAPVAATTRAGRVDGELLAQTLPQLAHPALRTSAAVALAHLRADRGDWEGARSCQARMGPVCRSVVRASLDEGEDGPGVSAGVALLVVRATVGRWGGMGSDLPSEVLFCAVAMLHGRGLYCRAFAVGRRAWRADPQPVLAYSCGCALARLEQRDESLLWLRRALEAGYPAAVMALDTDLAGLRHLPEFQALD
jgi:hypothetical protein